MCIRFNCENPNCPRPPLRVGLRYVGQRAQCPNCGTINIVPSSFADIFKAAEKGMVEDVRYFIEQKGVDVNLTNLNGNAPLHFAVDNPDISVIKDITTIGANVNAKNNDGNTPLYFAARDNSNAEFLECLVSKGANVNEKCLNGYTPLHIAAQCNANVGILEYLISHKADVNAINNHGNTSLHLAAMKNASEEITKYLISHGADVNVRDNSGSTPLHRAVAYNPNVKVVELISQRANVNAKSNDGETPLHLAVIRSTTEEVIKWFISHRIDVNAREISVIKCLISHGADVNARENTGFTPLHNAVAFNPNIEVAKYLILHGADVNAKENDGHTPLDAANTEEKKRILREAQGAYNKLSGQPNGPVEEEELVLPPPPPPPNRPNRSPYCVTTKTVPMQEKSASPSPTPQPDQSYDSELIQLAGEQDKFATDLHKAIDLAEQHGIIFKQFMRGGDDNGADILREIERLLQTIHIDEVLAKAKRLDEIRRDARTRKLIECCEKSQNTHFELLRYISMPGLPRY